MELLVDVIKLNGIHLRNNWATKNRHSLAAPVEFARSFLGDLEIVGFFRRYKSLDAGQQLFFRQVVEGDLRRCFWNSNHVL